MCLYVDDDGSWVEMKPARRVKARKQHTCGECHRTIEPGEQYETWTGIVEDEHFYTGKACAHCMATVDIGVALTGCPPHWNVELMWDPYPEIGFAANILHDSGHDLTPSARALMRSLIDMAAAKWREEDGSLMPVPTIPEARKGAA